MAGRGKGVFPRVVALKLSVWSTEIPVIPASSCPTCCRQGLTLTDACLAQETPGIWQVGEPTLAWLGA